MIKKIAILSILAITLGLSFSCSSTPAKPEPTPTPSGIVDDWVIIDHKMKDFGGSIPEWVAKTPIDLEKTDKYKDYYVFIQDQSGKNREGLELWATGFSAPAEIARMVSTRVQSKFAGAAVGDKNELETYMEQVVKTVSEAQYSGVRVEDKYWVLKQNKSNTSQKEYRYLVLMTVPKTEIQNAIQRALDGAAKNVAKTPEKERAIANVKNLMDEGL